MKKTQIELLLLAQTALCILMVLLRNTSDGWFSGHWAQLASLQVWEPPHFLFLGWNLFLAWIPFGLAAVFSSARGNAQRISTLLLWLLFLPNAPYLITDLIHLRPHNSVPLWYDAALLFSAAWTGLLLGYCSLLKVESGLRSWWGRRYANAFVGLALLLSGFGIYLGRFLRWNSWDAFLHPISLLEDILGLMGRPSSLLLSLCVTLLFSTILGLGYHTIFTLSKREGS